jgi:hypothetical protein
MSNWDNKIQRSVRRNKPPQRQWVWDATCWVALIVGETVSAAIQGVRNADFW